MGSSIWAILIALPLGGCAATTAQNYAKAGASQEETERQLAKCKVQGAMVPGEGAAGAGHLRTNARQLHARRGVREALAAPLELRILPARRARARQQ